MTVLYCLSHITKSLQWLWFAEEMQKRGIKQVYILLHRTKWGHNFLYEDLKKHNIEVHQWESSKKNYLSNITKTRRLILKKKADIIHTSLPHGNLVGQTAAWLTGLKKRVTTCENVSWAHDFKNKKQEGIDNYTFKRAKKIIATSDIAADYLRNKWDFDKSKLEIIYHALKPMDYNVSEERIEKVKKQLPFINNKDFNIGVISRFEFWKGHEYIIEAARLLKDKPEIKFYIFGSKGSYFEYAMQKISENGLQEKVIYAGFVNDTSALYKLFDVHLHVPVNEYVETGGITILEGMMAGVPQVLTRSGYAWQTAKHMHNAYVVPFRDARAIADALLWIRENPKKANELASQAHEDALEFSVDKKTEKHISLYQQLLQ